MVLYTCSMPQISPAKHWCFTFNNYAEHLDAFTQWVQTATTRGVFQQEIGASGTPHLQGVVAFASKVRPLGVTSGTPWATLISWQKTRSWKDSIGYCQKQETRAPGAEPVLWGGVPPITGISRITSLRPWQGLVWGLLQPMPDPRTIFWVWEPTGNSGKSSLTKKACLELGALLLSGKGADVKCGVARWVEQKGTYPRVIIYDLPRSFNQDYLNYTALEEIKNGCFFSGKYESGMVIGEHPHLVIFANEEPDYSKLSHDRWVVIDVRSVQGPNPQ